jgi:hypothetical protein
LNDVVFYQGSSYICILAGNSTGFDNPSTDPVHWSLMAQQGVTGPAGSGTGTDSGTGYTGPTGPTGSVLIYSTIFDGGNASTNYILGPAFNCGSAQ